MDAAGEAVRWLEYLNSYADGQDDYFKAVTGQTLDEPRTVALCATAAGPYALWCLVHNISIAGALRLAHEYGQWDGAGYHLRHP